MDFIAALITLAKLLHGRDTSLLSAKPLILSECRQVSRNSSPWTLTLLKLGLASLVARASFSLPVNQIVLVLIRVVPELCLSCVNTSASNLVGERALGRIPMKGAFESNPS